MSLAETLSKANEQNREKIPNEVLAIMDKSTKELKDQDLAAQATGKGDVLPEFKLPNVKGNIVSLRALLEKQPLVVSFYRGGWCPYCNLQLKALQDTLGQIEAAGAKLIAITPETPDNSLTTSEKNDLKFEVLSDIDNVYAKELGLVFQLPESIQEIYEQFGLDLEKHNGNKNSELPMPATYVVDQTGKIVYAFVNEDYTLRAEPSDIVAALRGLKA